MTVVSTLGSLWRALTVFRWVTLAWAGLLIVRDQEKFHRPVVALAVLVVMVAWTALATVSYERWGRAVPRWVLILDLTVASAACLATPLAWSATDVSDGVGLLPATWAAGAVGAWAIAWGPFWGSLAGAVMGITAWVAHGRFQQQTASEFLLFVLVGGVVGQLVRLARRGAEQLARAVELQAATEERERLAREIHDEVLQALAFIHKKGCEAGGAAAELAELAAQQEVVLRRLVTRAPIEVYGDDSDLRAPLRAACDAASVPVEFAGPGSPVVVPDLMARELTAAVTQALENVARHAGPHASAWVFVDDDGQTLTVSVRDDGVGCSSDDLALAEEAGRLGVAQSMRGRIEALGGTMTLDAVPGQGVEVEFRVQR